jgi:hypothetical protein
VVSKDYQPREARISTPHPPLATLGANTVGNDELSALDVQFDAHPVDDADT